MSTLHHSVAQRGYSFHSTRTLSCVPLQVAEDAEDIRREVACLTVLKKHPTIARLKDTFEDTEVSSPPQSNILYTNTYSSNILYPILELLDCWILANGNALCCVGAWGMRLHPLSPGVSGGGISASATLGFDAGLEAASSGPAFASLAMLLVPSTSTS